MDLEKLTFCALELYPLCTRIAEKKPQSQKPFVYYPANVCGADYVYVARPENLQLFRVVVGWPSGYLIVQRPVNNLTMAKYNIGRIVWSPLGCKLKNC